MRAGEILVRVIGMGLWLMVATTGALAASSGEQLDRTVELFQQGDYTQAQELALSIDPKGLSDEQQQRRDELLEELAQAVNQSTKARQNLADADKAFSANDRDGAERFFQAVKDNPYASADQKRRAAEGLALIAQQRQLDQALVSPATTQPEAEATATQPEADDDATATPTPVVVEESAVLTPVPAAEVPPPPAASQPVDELAQARFDRDRIVAAELIREGDEAIARGQYDLAAQKFEAALQRVPNHPAALNGLQIVSQNRQVEGRGSLLDEASQRSLVRWQRTETLFQQNDNEIREQIRNNRFDEARQKVAATRQLVEAARRDAQPPQRYTELVGQLDALTRFIDEQERSFKQSQAIVERREAMEREHQRQEADIKERDARVNALFDQVMEFQREKQYEKALDALEEILVIDPQNRMARSQRMIYDELNLIDVQRNHREDFNVKKETAFLSAERAMNPEVLGDDEKGWVYYGSAESWRIKAERDPFGSGLSGENEQDRRVRQALDSVIPPVEFESTTFGEVIDYLKTVSKVPLDVNWTVLLNSGVERTTPVEDVSFKNIKLEVALQIILEKVGGADSILGYDIIGGVILISDIESLNRNLVTKVYDVRDLLIKVRSFEAPDNDEGGMGGMGGMGMGGYGSGSSSYGGSYGSSGGYGSSSSSDEDDDDSSEEEREELAADLEDLIKNQIEPGSWSPDGIPGSLVVWNDRMIVTHTPRAHRKLVELFKQLREAKDLQVAVEARFISLTSNFLEEIGVDLDVVLNNGNAGLDRALSNDGMPVVDPYSGTSLLQPRQFTQIGVSPAVASVGGQSLSQGVDLEQPYGNVGLVPQGSSSNYWSRHSTPVPMVNNTLAMVNARSTGVPGSLTSDASSAGPAFSMFGSFLDNIQVDFLLRATQMDARSSTLDAPRLVVFNGRSAYIEVNTYVSYVSTPGYRPAGGSGVGGYAATGQQPSISSLPRGRTLTVKPTVSGDRKYVTIEVRPEVTNVSLRSIPAQDGGLSTFFEVPETSITTIRTTVSVPDGGTILLGGLKLAGETEVEAGVPMLSKIPVLKRAFTNRAKVKDEYVLLVLIKPSIIIQEEQEKRAFPDMITADQIGS